MHLMTSTEVPATHSSVPVVVPALQRWSADAGSLALADGFQVLWADSSLEATARQLVSEIAELAGLTGTAASAENMGAGTGDLVLVLDPALDFGTDNSTAAAEGYVLTVGTGVVLASRTSTGVFWATRSLLQMLLSSPELPRGTAVDWPNYPVRGFMLDVGRRFSQVGYLQDMVRYMGWFKLNTFLVHLNDNEIAKDTKRSWDVAEQAFRLESENPRFAGLAATDGSYSRAEWDSLEELAAAHHVNLVPEIDVPAHALMLGAVDATILADCREQGVAVVHEATDEDLGRYAAAAWATALERALEASAASTVLAGGTERGTEVLAHLATRRGLPMAANVLSVTSTDPVEVERQVAGGAVREQMRLDARPAVMTMAGHAVEPVPAASPGPAEHRPFTAGVTPADLRAQVLHVQARGGGDSSAALTAARVVVGAGRGAGSADGFRDVDALARRLGGAVGVSRAVTSLGWRPHHEQVGQTGSRIAPDVYIACGISGAIQHWAGCSSSRTIIAINTDAEAPMMTKADYAVVGDMHEVLPALLEALG